MAKVFERSGMWYVRFQHKGKDYFRSTSIPVAAGKKAYEESRGKAEIELSRMISEHCGRESAEALFARLSEALASLPNDEREAKRITFAERLRQGVVTRLAIADAWEAWLNSPRKRDPGAGTLEMYLAYWGRSSVKKHGNRKGKNGFKNWLSSSHPEVSALHEVTPAIAEEYATHLWQSCIAPRTYNGTIKFLRGMFKVLHRRAGIAANPWEEIQLKDNDTQGRRDLTAGELRDICGKAQGELRYWLAIGLYTGLRLGDVITLRWKEVAFDDGVIRRIPNKTKRKGKVLTFPLHPVLAGLLRELRESSAKDAEWLFPDAARDYTEGNRYLVSRQIQKHFEDCHITTTEQSETGHRRQAIVKVGFHSLRHSFVSLCAARNVPQATIQDLVGHSSPAMTRLYEHADEKQKARAIAKLPVVAFTPTN